MAILERQLRKMLVFKSLLVASLLVSSLAQEITEQESEQKSVVKSTENSEEIKRQGPQQAGWGGLISGLLGSITKTAEVNECPGKCLHALASLLCEEVREDIGCPSAQMRCCVDRRNDNSTPSNGDQSQVESTTKKRLRPPPPPPPRTTPRTTTTTTTTTTQRAVPDVASNKQDKFGDYEYTDDESNSLTSRQNSASRFIMTSSAFLLCSTFLLFI